MKRRMLVRYLVDGMVVRDSSFGGRTSVCTPESNRLVALLGLGGLEL